MPLRAQPLTPDRWPDLEAIFNARGCSIARGCWCMYYRVSGTPAQPAAATARTALRALVDAGPPPGLLGYRDGVPVGWVSLGPREAFAKLRRSPVMKPVDELPVWSIVCFVVPGASRGQGVARSLLDAAIRYAREQGAKMLEAYPVDKPDWSRDDAMWFGSKSMYEAAGFQEVARRKPHRPVVRLALGRR